MPKKQVFVFIFFVPLVFFIQGCKVGCTDKNAFNFSHSAKENDGSCLYCDSSNISNGTTTFQVEDENPQSQYYFDEVLRILVSSQEVQINGNGCRVLGYGNSTNPCNNYSNNLQLVNTTSSKITFTGQLSIFYESQNSGQTQTLTYNFNSAQVGAFDTLKLGNIGSVCVPGDFAFLELDMNNTYTIQYH